MQTKGKTTPEFCSLCERHIENKIDHEEKIIMLYDTEGLECLYQEYGPVKCQGKIYNITRDLNDGGEYFSCYGLCENHTWNCQKRGLDLTLTTEEIGLHPQ